MTSGRILPNRQEIEPSSGDLPVIHVREAVPHFDVADIHGTRVSYATIWQRKHLVLVVLKPGDEPHYVTRLGAVERELADLQTRLVITRESVAGIDAPGVIVADRWGEVAFARSAPTAGDLPDPAELVEWAQHLQHKCPECEGEAR
jgi:hypothetical protein